MFVKALALVAMSAIALIAGLATAPSAIAHGVGNCDVIPWNPVLHPDGYILGQGQAQCFPETHSTWDVETCLQYRQLPVGGYEEKCNRVTLSNHPANGVTVVATTKGMTPQCRDGFWRTWVSAVIGGHPRVTNTSPEILIVCPSVNN
jgi:hypothetical protein